MSHVTTTPGKRFTRGESVFSIDHIPASYDIGDLFIDDNSKAPIWNGHEFEIVNLQSVRKSRDGRETYDISVRFEFPTNVEWAIELYYGIDQRIKTSDVAGAKRAYLNSDEDGWLFAHTDEGTHHDYELNLLAACDGVFQPFFRQLQVDSYHTSESVSERGKRRFIYLSEFYGEVVRKARSFARGIFLGEREQSSHPKEGWLDRDITAAIIAVKSEWLENKSSKFTEISSAITYVETSLNMPSVETRWDREARLKKETEDNNDSNDSN